jgi:predicted deacetylase
MPCSPVYEFHDITASNFLQVAAQLHEFGSDICWNFMVIPFFENTENKENFAAQLLKWKNEGHVLHLHGYKHKANLNLKRSLMGRLALRITNSEAEFAGLSKEDSKAILEKALEAWKNLNVGEARGFTAPAWYGSNALFYLCKDLGFENYSSRFIIWNRGKGSKLSVPFSTAGLPKILIPFVKIIEKIYLKFYSLFSFLPVPRIVAHPICNLK